MNTVEFGMWRPELFEEGFTQMNSGIPVDRIVLYAQEEFEYDIFQYFEFLVEYSDKHNVPFDIILCTDKHASPRHDITNRKYRHVKLHYWCTFFLSQAYSHLIRTKDHLTPAEFKYPYVSMNAKPHVHRSLMLDTLAKYNLIDNGAVSWLEIADSSVKPGELASVVRGYPYKYWTPVIKKLTEPGPNRMILEVPAEYKQSFAQLVVESTVREQVISEKTWMPILYRKPFVVLAHHGHHAILQRYGFELYDEYIDYSFDSVQDINVRAEAVAQNIARLVAYPEVARHKIYKRLLPKLEHNYNLAVSLATDIKQVPEIILDAHRDPLNGYCSRHIVDFIYE